MGPCVCVLVYKLNHDLLKQWVHTFIAAQLLGFRNNIPPHARTRGRAILGGLNFASGAAGIRDETGNNLVKLHTFVLYIYILY